MVARQLVELLEALGHEVLTRHLVSDNAEIYRRNVRLLVRAG